ncbi:MAG: hypothetical protein HYZ42_00585, partial [Bacteroidetes bacterium]|nr:hypothetical protein [Bacteroidota bacterium]
SATVTILEGQTYVVPVDFSTEAAGVYSAIVEYSGGVVASSIFIKNEASVD